MGAYPPVTPDPGPVCWLCGGATGGVGWRQRDAIPPTYTNHTLAVVPSSTAVCQPCAAMGSKETWGRYVAAHPDAGLKTGHAMSWRCYSHLFAETGHECPTRSRWRAILLDPPVPPFLAIMALSGQKHLIFRGQVAHSRDWFAVQLEEQRVWIERRRFAACLNDVEIVLNLGFSRDGILTGRYHPAQLLKIGPAVWRPLEQAIARWRYTAPALLGLAVHVAQREEATP